DVEAELELAYGDERVTVPVRVGGTVPGVDVTPARLSLGNVVVNGEIVATAVRLTNSGQAPLRVEGSRLEGSDARHFQIDGDGCAGATLRPTESCRVDISFDPARAGEHRAALRLAHNAGGGETRVPLGGIGIAPKIEVGRSRVTFPSLMVGEAVEQRLEIRNTGRAPLRIGRMRITGGEAADFALDGACAGAILAPGKRCSTGVRFAPSAPGDRRSELIVEHDATDSPLRLAVRGEATPPPVARIRTEPRRLDFAALMVGNRGDIATVVIQNPGTGPLELLGIRIRGAAARDFTVVPGSCDAAFRVDPGASCTVGVRFAPTEGGARDAELEIRHNASDAVYVVALSGRGLTPTPPVPPPTGEGGSTSNR
ncbi:MAG: choice-of-anchor D domain-containing protein, partial [Acidobacteriota bacterium]